MGTMSVEQSRIIDATPEAVYAIVSDYRVGHPAILPKPYFTELTVEQGGQGTGTVLRTRMKVYGRVFVYHQKVTEPEPGRILLETDLITGQTTTFTVEPLDGGKRTRVTIASIFPLTPGIVGMVERLMQPSIVKRIYQQELDNLAEYARSQSVAA